MKDFRLSLRKIARHLFILAICVAAAGAPSLLLAQDRPSAVTQPPVAQPSTGQSAADQGSPAKQEPKAEKKSEAEETLEYRHSATVRWFSRLFHLDVEATASLFEWINFAIVFFAVVIPLFKILPQAMRKRSARLSVELEVAQAKTTDANERLRAVETKLAGLDLEINKIRQQVEEDMRGDEARIRASIEEETARIVAASEYEITIAGSQAQRGLRQFAADLAIDRALSQLSFSAEADSELVAEFAHDFGASRGKRKGGQN